MVGVNCPFCDSSEVERVAQWGGQIITAQWRCGACRSYFEAIRDDYNDSPISAPMTSVMPSGTPSSQRQPANRPDAA